MKHIMAAIKPLKFDEVREALAETVVGAVARAAKTDRIGDGWSIPNALGALSPAAMEPAGLADTEARASRPGLCIPGFLRRRMHNK